MEQANGTVTDPPGQTNHSALMGIDSPGAYRQLMGRGLDLVEHAFASAEQPFTGIHPHELARRFDPLDLHQPLAGGVDQALRELQQLYLEDTVYYHHPRYVAHLNCPVFVVSLLAEVIAGGLNTAVETWDQSAGATLIEQKVVDWTTRLLGLGNRADGVFTTGGTQSNLMGLMLAREAAQRAGDDPRRYRILCSRHSHFSLQKAARVLGLAPEAVVPVATDRHRRLCPEALERQLDEIDREGNRPIAIAATAGTTDFGSIDPLEALADLAGERSLWLHVDAAYGGALACSANQRHRLRGIERADSVSIDYHKAFFQPLCCSAFLVSDAGHLGHFTERADYLNPAEQTREGLPDAVNKSLQTSRRFDALKMWLTLRVVGAERIGAMLDELIEKTRALAHELTPDPDTELAHDPALSTLVFRFREPELDERANDHLNRQIRKQLARQGEAVIAGTTVDGRQFLKFTLLDPQTPLATLKAIHYRIKRQGRAIGRLMRQAQAEAEVAQ